MTRWIFWPLLFLTLSISGAALAQGDTLHHLEESGTLVYEMNYDQLVAVAEADDCPQEAFENSLLHSVVRHLFLYLPFEASYYSDVTKLEVVIVRAGEDGEAQQVLRASGTLEDIRATNTRFRAFMNSFASIRAGYCFDITRDTLDLWLSVLTTRGGVLEIDGDVFAAVPAQAVPLAAATGQPETAAAEPVETVAETPATGAIPEATDTPTPFLPEGFGFTPPLSELRVLTFAAPDQVLEDATDYAAVLETSKGRIVIDLFEEQTPQTVNSFVFLARHRFFDGVSFHRVLEAFMAQTGDPSGSGLGGPGYQFGDEIVAELIHDRAGVVSMVNAGPGTNGSQFFITLEPTPWLDGLYTVFGAVTEGQQVLADLQRLDPTVPLALVLLDDTLGLLATQGVALEGPDEQTVGEHLSQILGRPLQGGERVPLAAYDALVGQRADGEPWQVGFWPRADRIDALYIVQRPR